MNLTREYFFLVLEVGFSVTLYNIPSKTICKAPATGTVRSSSM